MSRDLRPLLEPRSIVFVGGAECDVAIRKTLGLGFTGKIWAVHPKREQLGGIATVKSASEVEGPVDAAFIAVKREPTVEVLRTLRAKGLQGAVIYASGFAETGDTALQDELLAAADGIPLMGPNCYGFVNGLSRVALWPDEHGIVPGESGVAIITQSGNMACNLVTTMRGLPVALTCAIGNQADVDMAQLVESCARDPRITAIGLHIEGLRDVPAFAQAATVARELRKPIVVLKTGRSEQGARVTMSHTSSLSGADALYDALFRRYGVARVKSVSALVETLKFLHCGGAIGDSRLVSMSCSGGEAALAADMALDRVVSFPPFTAATRERVAATLNEYVSVENPLDYHTFIWGQPEKLEATYSAVLGGGYDVAMLILDTPTHPATNPASWVVAARALVQAARNTGARAAVVATLHEGMPLDLANELAAAGVAPMMGLDDALTAFEAAAFIGRNWAQDAGTEDNGAAGNGAAGNGGPASALPVLAHQPASIGEPVVYTEKVAKDLLATFGLPVPEGRVCAASDAVAVAEQLGYPVTLKVSSAAIAHKTEAGGVVLNLRSAEEVAAAAARLALLAPEVLVERMVTGAVAELILGLTRDPQFGTALVVGAGGILTELLHDSATLLLPTSEKEVREALAGLKCWPLVTGFRGRHGDAEAVVRAVQALAAFAAAHAGRIEEVDVNPLLVTADGAVAVDALIRMRPA